LDPDNANRYEYAADDLINNTDSSGEYSFADFALDVGVIGGGHRGWSRTWRWDWLHCNA
jgi:hypothetical protein